MNMKACACVRGKHNTLNSSFYACIQRRTQLQEQMSFRYKERLKCQTLPIKQEQVHSCRKDALLLQLSYSVLCPSLCSKQEGTVVP